MPEKAQTMKIKTFSHEGTDYAVLQDGKPVYIGDDGKEIAFDAVGTSAAITRLNGEAKGHREAKEKAETALKLFDGLDAAAARKAIEDLGKIDQKRLIDAGEVDKVKADISKAFQEKLDAAEARATAAEKGLYEEKIGGSFSRSKFVTDKVAVPVHMLERTYGGNFKIEDGKVVGYDANGSRLYSRANPNELATFDEALELIINADPHKDHILRGDVKPGGGANNGGNGGGAKTIKQVEFDALNPKERAAKMADGYTVEA